MTIPDATGHALVTETGAVGELEHESPGLVGSRTVSQHGL